jgi:hypothetical protein
MRSYEKKMPIFTRFWDQKGNEILYLYTSKYGSLIAYGYTLMASAGGKK